MAPKSFSERTKVLARQTMRLTAAAMIFWAVRVSRFSVCSAIKNVTGRNVARLGGAALVALLSVSLTSPVLASPACDAVNAGGLNGLIDIEELSGKFARIQNQTFDKGDVLNWSYSASDQALVGLNVTYNAVPNAPQNVMVVRQYSGASPASNAGSYTIDYPPGKTLVSQVLVNIARGNEAEGVSRDYATVDWSVSCTPFQLPAPVITAQPANSSIVAGANTTFEVTASNATGYQWQVNTGSGFSEVTNGGVYSGVTTSTLTITGATLGMSSYAYRVVVSGSTAPNATSDAATLTVTPPAPTITGVSPASGLVGGGTTVVITGANLSGVSSVMFGGSAAAYYTVDSPTQITATAPAGTGNVDISVTTAGGTSANTAADDYSYFTIPGAPTIGTATAGNGQATVTFTPPASDGGSAITQYTVSSNPPGFTATGSASPITVTGLSNSTAYTFTVTATNGAGIGPASAASNSVTPRAPQTITFTNPGTQNFGTSPTLTATASSSLPVLFSSSTPGVCTITVGGALTFLTAGSCTINADQAGDGTYLPAPQVSQTFTVAAVVPGAPTIGTATAGDSTVSVSFTAPATNGGSTIFGYTVTSDPGGATGTGSASPITVAGLSNGTAYTFTVTATNGAGTGAASAASNSVTPMVGQTINFSNPGAQTFGTTPTLSATATSGLPVTFSSSTSEVCTIAGGGALTTVSVGTCTINADQAGNAEFDPAPQVSHSFAIAAAVPGAPTGVSAVPGDGQAEVSFTAPAHVGGSPISGYVVTADPGGVTATGSGGPIVVAGLTNGTSYTFTVVAVNGAGPGAASAPSAAAVPGQTQTIDFADPGAQVLGTVPQLAASASSGLPVSFASSTAGVCTINPTGQLTTVTPGTCTIEANQAGGSGYYAATPVSRSFQIVPTAITITPASGALPQAMAGEAYATDLNASGQSGGLIWALANGSLPGGMVLNVSSGELTGPVNADAAGDYSFTITATDQTGGGVGTANYTLSVDARAVTVESKSVVVPAGATPPPVDLTEGATGGPFTSAEVASVEPPIAGTAEIIMGEMAAVAAAAPTGFYLKFTPNPEYSGTAYVRFRLQSALGTSNLGTVSITMAVDVPAVSARFEDLSREFVETRSSLLANGVNAPTLRDRRAQSLANQPGVISVSPASGNSVTLNFAASSLQWAAFDAMDQLVQEPVDDDLINFWIDGTATLHVRTGAVGDNWGSFALLSIGADMLVTEDLMAGVALHTDWMDDNSSAHRTYGQGVMVGPYLSAEIGDGVFVDASLFYGRSWNDVSTGIFSGTFDTQRLLGKASVTGDWALSEALTFRPKAQLFYLHESAAGYTVSDGSGTTAMVSGFELEQLRLSGGGSLHYLLETDNGLVVRPHVGLQLGLSLSNGQPSSFATVTAGADLAGTGNWTFGLSTSAEVGGAGFKSVSARARLSGGF